MFDSVEKVETLLSEESYICDRKIATVVFLAEKLEKPVLVEGPAGVGKTELAKVVAAATGRSLVRLQCYEGLDEAKALYEWEYSKQLLYTQILKERFTEVMAGTQTLAEAAERVGKEDSVFFSEHFIVRRPLLHAITAAEPTLLLVDEVDKSDPEFEAFLLEVLSDFQVTVPEIGTLQAVRAQAAGLPDLEQRPRDERRPQAPLPPPVHRLPQRGARAAHPGDEGPGRERSARP
jgi:MoxR-like ATPase